eukprot:3020106-Alexandrium_andersonii.AAC.1
MSASLVGSEMCIRDSPCGTFANRTRQPWPSPLVSMKRSTASACDSPGSVSYTHLTLPTICSV